MNSHFPSRLSRPIFASVFAIAAILIGRTAIATAVPFLTGAGTTFASNGAFTLGYQVIVGSSPVQLTSLGVWDEDGNGLVSSHAVGIWGSSTTTPLAQVAIPSGTGATLVDGYRFSDLTTPITLAANTTYVLGAAYNSTDSPRDITGSSFAGRNSFASPGATIGFGEFEFGSSLTYPSGDVSTIYNGPNGLFTVIPEPACLSVLLLTMAALRRGR